ncbi:efflux RND transporter periplasmic adaptor subunit [Panacagrimonas perspica]|nr:efflux RND transporter periplasmic adaptor subunit [Panacagrimonas perspica]
MAACSGKKEAPPPPPSDVSVIELKPQAARVTVEYVAETEAFNTVEIRPRVGGLLDKVEIVEGARVKKGQVLFVIDSQPYLAARAEARAAVAQARSATEQAERDFERVSPLAAMNAVSQQEVDAVKARLSAGRASVDAALAALKTAELNLDYTTVTAPIDGIVGRAQIRIGGLVTAYSTLLTTVYDTDPMYVNFSISERRMLELQHRYGINREKPSPTAVFHVVLADGTEHAGPVKLNFIDAAVDRATGTLPIRLVVDNEKGELLTGQFARVLVDTDRLDNALLVPQRAVQELQGKTSVWVVDADNKVQPRDVTMGARIGSDWLVQQGLKAGEHVVIEGMQKLKPGAPVNAKVADAPPPAVVPKADEPAPAKS